MLKKTRLDKGRDHRPWWLSGLSHHVSNSSRDKGLGPRFKSCSRHGTVAVSIN